MSGETIHDGVGSEHTRALRVETAGRLRGRMPRRGTTAIASGLLRVLLTLAALGCAPQRGDWIEGTLVTVDVSGTWKGWVWTPSLQGEMEMTLTQQGPKVTGKCRVRTVRISIEGTVRGDVFAFADSGGRLRAEATVSGDEMSGEGRSNLVLTQQAMYLRIQFKLSR